MRTDEEVTSWKQIAAHLGVNVRTAQKWEKERGLPVRRLPGGRGRVTLDLGAYAAWQRTPVPLSSVCYRWPVAKDIIAEVHFLGGPITAQHVERLLHHLELTKEALQP